MSNIYYREKRISAVLTVALLVSVFVSFLTASPRPEEVWAALTGPKGTLVAKIEVEGVQQFVFFSGANYGPKSSTLRVSSFRCGSIEEAQAVCRVKPTTVRLSEPLADHVIDDASIMRRMTKEERVALGIEEKAEPSAKAPCPFPSRPGLAHEPRRP